MKNPEKLIGKKVRGFKFEKINDLFFTERMEKYIGKIGVIEKYDKNDNTFLVRFNKESGFYYPADQIEDHLVEEEIPTLSDGVMMLVSFNDISWHERKVIGKKNGVFYGWNGDSILAYKSVKQIEPTKEEQLTAILGSSEKVSEIMELFKN